LQFHLHKKQAQTIGSGLRFRFKSECHDLSVNCK